MQKLLFTAIIAALLFSCNNSDNNAIETSETVIAAESDWATSHLKGMVKTVEETGYTPDEDGKIGKMDSCCVEVREYNEKGYTIKYHEKDSEGTVTSESNYERIDGAKFKSAKRTVNGKQVWGRTTHYDPDGKILYAVDTDTTGKVSRFYNDITENEIGQALKGKMYTADSTYLGTWSFEYIDGMRTGSSFVDTTGTQVSKIVGELNEQGYLAKTTNMQVSKDGTTTTVETYTYDSFDDTGNWTQRTQYNEDGKAIRVEKRTYTYF